MNRSLACLMAVMMLRCGVSLTPPSGSTISCTTVDECPGNLVCNLEIGQCLLPGEDLNTAPQLVIEPVARQVGAVAFSIVVTDDESDQVTLAGRYDTGAGFQVATLEFPAITASREGTRVSVVWRADLDRGTTSYVSNVTLELIPSDDGGSGAPVVSAPFEVGDDLPAISSFDVVQPGVQSGNVIVSLVVSDPALDSIDILTLEVTHDGTFSDVPTIIPNTEPISTVILSGATTGLESDSAGVQHRFTWNSALTSVVDAPTTQLRVSISDPFMDEAMLDPIEAVTPVFHLRNQLPPRITALSAPGAQAFRSPGPISLSYILSDENSDSTDVVMEYSLDGGLSFRPCIEYRVPESEGTEGLAAAPIATGGIEHVYVWDTAGAADLSDSVAVVRASVPGGSTSTVNIAGGLGPTLGTPYDTVFGSDTIGSIGSIDFAYGNFDDDGVLDAYSALGAIDILVRGCVPMPCFASFNSFMDDGGAVSRADAGDLDGDQLDDIVVARNGPDRIAARLSSGGFATSMDVTMLPGEPDELFVGDVDGDSFPDFVTFSADTVTVWYGMGGLAVSAPQSVILSDTPAAVRAISLMNDERMDFVVLHPSPTDAIAVLRGSANRTTVFDVTETAVGYSAAFLAAGALNEDGVDNDILIAGGSLGGRAAHFEVDAAANAVELQQIPASVSGFRGIDIGDMNGDGRNDLVFAENFGLSSGRMTFLPNWGSLQAGSLVFGTLTPMEVFQSPTQLTVVDFNGDGYDEVVARDDFNDSGFLAFGRVFNQGIGAGAFGDALAQNTAATQYEQWASVDVDGDGRMDHVFYDTLGQRFDVWYGTGVRGIAHGTPVGPFVSSSPGSSVFSLRGGDDDGDGLGDLWFMSGPDGFLMRGNGDGTFAAPIPASRPPGFSSSLAQAQGPLVPGADIDGDGIRDAISESGSAVGARRGSYPGRPGSNPFAGEIAFEATSNVNYPILDIIDNVLRVGDLNNDGFADLLVGVYRFANELYFIYGQNEAQALRTLTILPFVSSPPSAVFGVSSDLTDVVGQSMSGHIARAALYEQVVDWEEVLKADGLVSSTALPLTAPYQLLGDIRLTPATSGGPLVLEARLGDRVAPTSVTDFSRVGLDLAATPPRGLIVDLPILEGHTAQQIADEVPRVYMRLVSYLDLDPEGILRQLSWVELPRDADDDLTTGAGPRFAVYQAPDGTHLVRALVDQAGLLQGFIEPP